MKKSTQKVLAMFIILAAIALIVIPFAAVAETENIVPATLDLMGVIQQYAMIPVAVACLLIGWLLKHTIDVLDNKWIPLVLVIVGLLGVLWINNWAFTPQIFMSGLCSAALAVWIHNNYKNLTEKPPEQ